MRLWTIQEVPFWNRLKGARRIRANRRLVERGTGGSMEAMPAYDWLATRMEAKIGARPSPRAMPLWAWQQYSGAAHTRPDLRSRHFRRGTKGVRIEFEIDDGAVVLSDFDEWHFVLNGSCISESEKDDDAFYASVPKKWHSGGCWKPDFPPRHRRRIEASWEKIFDIDRVWDDEEWRGSSGRDGKAIQATLWSIDIGMVRRVDEFTAR